MNAKPIKNSIEDIAEVTITYDDIEYKLDEISESAKSQLSNVKFVDQQIRQLQNEWAIADTARLGYQAALLRELKKPRENS